MGLPVRRTREAEWAEGEAKRDKLATKASVDFTGRFGATCPLELSRTEVGPGLCMPAIPLVIVCELFLLLTAIAEEALSCELLVANTPGSL